MPEGSYAFHIGSVYCTVLTDGYCAYPTPWFFPNADPEQLGAALDRRRLPHDQILSPYTCLLIESGREIALVDTGGGAALRTTGAIVARLEMAGLAAPASDKRDPSPPASHPIFGAGGGGGG